MAAIGEPAISSGSAFAASEEDHRELAHGFQAELAETLSTGWSQTCLSRLFRQSIGDAEGNVDLARAIELAVESDASLSIMVVAAALQPMTADYPVATAWIEQRQEEIKALIEFHRHAEELCSKVGISFDVDRLYDDKSIPGTIFPSYTALFLPWLHPHPTISDPRNIYRRPALMCSRGDRLAQLSNGVFIMGRGILLWLLGIPLPIIILLALFMR